MNRAKQCQLLIGQFLAVSTSAALAACASAPSRTTNLPTESAATECLGKNSSEAVCRRVLDVIEAEIAQSSSVLRSHLMAGEDFYSPDVASAVIQHILANPRPSISSYKPEVVCTMTTAGSLTSLPWPGFCDCRESQGAIARCDLSLPAIEFAKWLRTDNGPTRMDASICSAYASAVKPNRIEDDESAVACVNAIEQLEKNARLRERIQETRRSGN